MRLAGAVSALALGLAGCAVGPDYHRPSAPTPPAFKEAAGWTPSHPVDAIDKGAWWSMFNDPDLNALEQRVAVSNQTVKQFEAEYRQAHDIVSEAKSAFFPTVSAAATGNRSKGPAGSTATTGTITGTTGTTGTTGVTTTPT